MLSILMNHVNSAGIRLVLDAPREIPVNEAGFQGFPSIYDDHGSAVKIGSAYKHKEKEKFPKICSICGEYFFTTRKNKNICSSECKKNHVRDHARHYARLKRNPNKEKESCIVCGFFETTDRHTEGGKEYILCPNHHCVITRGKATLEDILSKVPRGTQTPLKGA